MMIVCDVISYMMPPMAKEGILCSSGAGCVGLIPANSYAQHMPSSSCWQFEMKPSPFWQCRIQYCIQYVWYLLVHISGLKNGGCQCWRDSTLHWVFSSRARIPFDAPKPEHVKMTSRTTHYVVDENGVEFGSCPLDLHLHLVCLGRRDPCLMKLALDQALKSSMWAMSQNKCSTSPIWLNWDWNGLITSASCSECNELQW